MNIAIASGKGGTGKTFVSTNLFWVIQHEGFPVTIVDCDAEEPNVTEFISGEDFSNIILSQNVPVIDPEKCMFCGKCQEYCNYKAIICLPSSRFIQVVEDLCHDCGACLVACEYETITEKKKKIGTVRNLSFNCHAQIIESRAEVGVYSSVSLIKEAIKAAINDPVKNQFNIFDSPPGISCPFIATVDKADYVVLVTEPTPFGLHDLKLSVETLKQLEKPFGVIVNRATLGNQEVYEWLQQNKIPLLLNIPMDREIARIYSEGHILAEEQPVYRELFVELFRRIKKQVIA